MVMYPFSEARAVLERCVDLAASLPEELTVQLYCMAGPDGRPVVLIVPTWCGQPEKGEAQVAPFLKLGTLIASTLDVTPYGRSLSPFDAYIVNGRRTFMETCWLPALDNSGIDVVIAATEKAASSGCVILTHEFKGAASRIPPEATAFGLRRDHVLVEILAAIVDRSDAIQEQRHQQWARDTRRAFDAIALPGGYANFLVGDDADRVAKSYWRQRRAADQNQATVRSGQYLPFDYSAAKEL
jgi:hypothetical protein